MSPVVKVIEETTATTMSHADITKLSRSHEITLHKMSVKVMGNAQAIQGRITLKDVKERYFRIESFRELQSSKEYEFKRTQTMKLLTLL